MSNPAKTYLTIDNDYYLCGAEVYEYKAEAYEGVDPEFLITDPNMTKKEWISRMITKLPLEYLPKSLYPNVKQLRGIQPPKFCFGFPLAFDRVKLHELATRLDIAVWYTDDDEGFVHPYGVEPKPTKRSNRPMDLNPEPTLDNLGKKIATDLGIKCKPHTEVVLGQYYCFTYLLIVCFMTSYDVEWHCEPEELNSRLANFLGVGEPMKWYVDRKVCTWYAAELEDEDGVWRSYTF